MREQKQYADEKCKHGTAGSYNHGGPGRCLICHDYGSHGHPLKMIDLDIPVRTVSNVRLIYVIPASGSGLEGMTDDGERIFWNLNGEEESRVDSLRLINDPSGLEVCDLSRLTARIDQAEKTAEAADRAVGLAEDALHRAEERASSAHQAVEKFSDVRHDVYTRAGFSDELEVKN